MTRYIKLFIRSGNDAKTNVIFIGNITSNIISVQLKNLIPFKMYKISSAVGDGTQFGNESEAISAVTKGNSYSFFPIDFELYS